MQIAYQWLCWLSRLWENSVFPGLCMRRQTSFCRSGFFPSFLHLLGWRLHPKQLSYPELIMQKATTSLQRFSVVEKTQPVSRQRVGHLNAGAEDAICTMQLIENGPHSFLAWIPRRSRLLDRLRMGMPTSAWLEGADQEWHEAVVHAREVAWEKLTRVEQGQLQQARAHWPQGWVDEVVVEVSVPTEDTVEDTPKRAYHDFIGGVPRT